MRIVHFSDVHIGVENYSKVDPHSGLSTRLMDFLKSFDEVVDYSLDNAVDLVVFSGDAYKSRDPSQTHQREFAKRIARLSVGGIPVFLVVGNHDSPHVLGRATALEIFQTLDVSKVYICDTPATHLIPTKSGNVQIVGVPWIRRSAFLAREDTRQMSPEQVNEEIQRSLSRIISSLAQELDPSIPAILAGHVTVSEATTSSEQSMMIGRDHVLLKSNVALPQFDYVALGHIHKHQILGTNPHVVYSGSLERIDFGEESHEKGFCVIELGSELSAGNRLQEFSFVTVNARRLLTISVSISAGDLDPMGTVLREIRKHELVGAIIRVNITAPGELEAYIRDSEIREALNGAHYVASVSTQISDERPRARLGTNDSRGLAPKEALKLYLESKDVDADRAAELMKYADRLMDG